MDFMDTMDTMDRMDNMKRCGKDNSRMMAGYKDQLYG